MTIFDDRERAAEYRFTHAEELRFLASRAGVAALAAWAAEALSYEASERERYVEAAIDRFVSGESESGIVEDIRAGLSDAGLAEHGAAAASIFAREVAIASDRLHGRHSSAPPASPSDPRLEHHRHEFWGWTV